MKTLIGHLAQFDSFFSQGEVLCTQGLAYLLHNSDARSRFATEITTRTGVTLPHDLTWRAEAYQAHDRGRPDLEARSASGLPVVKIEAKLGAALSAGQLQSYVDDLQGRSSRGVLIVLVPEGRIQEAARVVEGTFGPSKSGCWRPAGCEGVTVAVVSWEEIFEALRSGGPERLQYEVEQVEDMYRVVGGDYYIAPLAGPEELIAWRKREKDLVDWVDRATRRLTTDGRINPIGMEPLEQAPEGLEPKGYQRRYVCRPLGEDWSCYCLGLRDPFAGHCTPIWLRFDKRTPGFAMVSERLRTSRLEPRLLSSSGHIWIPLDLPFRVDTEDVVNALVRQAEEVATVAYRDML